jgi:hypothetical protein
VLTTKTNSGLVPTSNLTKLVGWFRKLVGWFRALGSAPWFRVPEGPKRFQIFQTKTEGNQTKTEGNREETNAQACAVGSG